MLLKALVVSLLVGCGGSAKPVAKPTPDPIPQTAGPSCRDVAAHLATLSDHDAAQDAKPDAALRGHCDNDHWSDEVRSCFATAGSDDEVAGCKTKLTADQQAAFPKSATPASAGKDPWADKNKDKDKDSDPPKDEGQHGTRGYKVKDKSKGKTTDPCEGGE
jgi:hypothetical protein